MSSYLVWISKGNNYHARNVDGMTTESRMNLFLGVDAIGFSAESEEDAITKAKEAGFNRVTRVLPVDRPDRSRTMDLPVQLPKFMEIRGYGNKKDN